MTYWKLSVSDYDFITMPRWRLDKIKAGLRLPEEAVAEDPAQPGYPQPLTRR